jgi:hypothetical protein
MVIAVSAIYYGEQQWLWAVRFSDSDLDRQGSAETFPDAMAEIDAVLAESVSSPSV